MRPFGSAYKAVCRWMAWARLASGYWIPAIIARQGLESTDGLPLRLCPLLRAVRMRRQTEAHISEPWPQFLWAPSVVCRPLYIRRPKPAKSIA
jgi:hypothetical protein